MAPKSLACLKKIGLLGSRGASLFVAPILTTPLQMERHPMVIHIIHTANHGKGIRSRVKLGKRGPKHHVETAAS